MNQSPQQKQRDFWIAFGITAGILLLIAVALRINADNAPAVTISYSTPIAASHSNTNVEQGAGSSTQVKFSEGTTTPHGVNGNPWGYDFDNTGVYIYDDIPTDFCKYFECANNFWTDSRTGYIVECQDGLYTRTGGYASVCNQHGGKKQALYWHP